MTKDIAFICDDNYCLPTAVCIQSIVDNYTSNEKLTVHVCTFGLTEQNVKNLTKMGNDTVCIVVDFFSDVFFVDHLKVISQKTHVTPTALIKFELPNYFSYLDTILYMDSDTVVKSDITELLEINVSDYYLAASYEFWEYLNIIRYTLKRVPDKFYFNSGIMLLNLNKMRKNDVTSKLWDYKINKAKTKLMDQESLNAVCGMNAIHLPIKWNFNPLFDNYSYLAGINKVYKMNYQHITEMEDDIKIIHYVGMYDKPWKYMNARMRQNWDNSFTRTPYAATLDLKIAKNGDKEIITNISDRIKKHGLSGLFCYMIYKIEKKIGNV